MLNSKSVLAVLAVMVTVCSGVPPMHRLSREKRVIGGEQYTKGEYPFHVSLWFMGDNSYTANTPDLHHVCGGSLIQEQWVLTSAACFDDMAIAGVSNLTMWEVYLGMYAQTEAHEEAEYRTIEQLFVAPAYNLTEIYGDLALLKLDAPAVLSDSVGLVSINTDPGCPAVGQEVEVIGWGQTQNETYGLGSDVPHEASVTVTSTEYCQSRYLQPQILAAFGPTLRIDDGLICAGMPEGGVDACAGDSGSPLLAKCGNDENEVVVGTVSYGYGCAQASYPGVYTRVSAYSEWIVETIMENKDSQEIQGSQENEGSQENQENKGSQENNGSQDNEGSQENKGSQENEENQE